MITPAQLAHWRKLADEATAGEWVVTGQISKTQREIYGDDFQAFDVEARYEDGSDSWYGLTPRCLKQRDAAFIAAARTAVPALLDEVESLRARVAEAEARAQTAEAQVKAQSATIAMLEEENKAIRDGTAVNIVYTDGTWKVVSKRSAWEYENDPDYLVTIPFIDWKLT